MRTAILCLAAAMMMSAQEYTRGIGVYPGDPKEDFGPVSRIDAATYRNLALRRPAFHSSAYDYNLTAQLLTDGVKAAKMPRWVSTSTSTHGVLKKNEREWLLDTNWVSAVDLKGQKAWVQVEIGGDLPQIDRIEIDGRVQGPPEPENWTCTILGSDDGRNWKPLGQASGMARPGGVIKPLVKFREPVRSRFYRVDLEDPRATGFQVGELTFFDGDRRVELGGPFDFTSVWMPAGKGEEWAYVDLGAACTFDRIVLHWARRGAEAALQVSDDASTWQMLPAVTAGAGAADEVKLQAPSKGRYLRVLLKSTSAGPYLLSELEVYGRGGPVPQPKPAPAVRNDGRLDLAGGNWRIQRDSLVPSDGAALSTAGFRDDEWVIATVPGTVLSSYYNAGALPDPNFGDNQLMISDSFFHADFWYRNEFVYQPGPAGSQVWLNFDGINWKADVFLNGEKLGRIEGGFTRARFDATRLMRAGRKNAIAVRIEKNAHPGSIKEKTFESPDKNGGVLGADNPTYHATIGWDWIPTIRGRDTGIWNDVFLSQSGPVTIEDPFVTSSLPLPDTSRADVSVAVTLRNHSASPVSGTVRGRFGDVPFEIAVNLAASSSQTVKADPSNFPGLRLQNPKLWWPAGYGAPDLYPVQLSFEIRGSTSDTKSFQAGIRQFAYNEDGGTLRMWINGRRFIPRGGNWGFGESMLRYRGREYDAAIRYHSDMHFNMIRNWVGQIGDDEFYEACDRHGVVVWQDFWLANPWDGPDPDENSIFMANANDMIRRIRNHTSIGLYCGRNEGYPPAPLDASIRKSLDALHPGIHYISSSADDVVSGHGPYQAMSFEYYFRDRAPTKMHSEMGMPNIPTMDSLRLMMPESAMWPQGAIWGLHDFCLTGAQGGASYRGRIDKSYGGATNVADWVSLAQFVNYEGHRAMFEAQSKYRMGLLIWMSHPTWPSFVWQTYDYFLEPTAAYFGSKKGSEPLHIQWNPIYETVEVVNYNGGDANGLTARVEVLNLDGSNKWEKSAALDAPEDSTASPIKMEYPADVSAVHFIRLKLTRGDTVVSENFYWRGKEASNYQELRKLPKVKLEAVTKGRQQDSVWLLATELYNPSASPALMVRLKAVREKSGDRILPVLYSDNFIALMPGERRTISTEVANADTRGESPRIAVEGFNVE